VPSRLVLKPDLTEFQDHLILSQRRGKPDNGASGAIYVFDRQREQWYMLSFEGCEDQFTSEKFDRAFSEYDLFRLVEQPGLLLSEFQPATA
jgi:hypothetical protein